MICFEISINGKLVCTAGIGELGILSAILTWVKRDPNRCPDGMSEDEWCKEELCFDVRGAVGHEIERERLQWIDQAIQVGDKITIQIENKSEPRSDR